MQRPMIIAPSILSADFAALGQAIVDLENAGADWIHVDVMDGHFVPNLTIGPPVVKALRPLTQLPFDVHLMIEAPERSIEDYVKAGADRVTVHAEVSPHLHRTLSQLRSLGVKAQVSLNPSTPLSAIEHVLELTDMVLLMTVNPGFGGQSFIEAVMPKVKALRTLANERGLADLQIQVDGGINKTTIEQAAAAGADVFVSGSGVFKAPSLEEGINELRSLASQSWSANP